MTWSSAMSLVISPLTAKVLKRYLINDYCVSFLFPAYFIIFRIECQSGKQINAVPILPMRICKSSGSCYLQYQKLPGTFQSANFTFVSHSSREALLPGYCAIKFLIVFSLIRCTFICHYKSGKSSPKVNFCLILE